MAPSKNKAPTIQVKRKLGLTPTVGIKKARIVRKEAFALTMDGNSTAFSNIASSANPGYKDNDAVTVAIMKELLANANQELGQKIDSIKASVQIQSEKLETLECEFDAMKKSFTEITRENELLWREVLRNNLVITGLKENRGESRECLYQEIGKLLYEMAGDDGNFDSAFRMGAFSEGRSRPIKVKFTSTSQRDWIWENRFKAPHLIYINEDLPKVTRKDHATLRNQRKQLIAKGVEPKQIRVNWSRKTITAEGRTQSIVKGELQDKAGENTLLHRVPNRISVPNTNQQYNLDCSSSRKIPYNPPPNLVQSANPYTRPPPPRTAIYRPPPLINYQKPPRFNNTGNRAHKDPNNSPSQTLYNCQSQNVPPRTPPYPQQSKFPNKRNFLGAEGRMDF
jgi:hypothetical protein